MQLMRSIPILLATALLAAPALSQAQTCGEIVTSSVTLMHDLHCAGSGAWFGLEVRGDGIVIDLNGHTISGDDAMHGILVWESSAVRVQGPGRITGFNIGVNTFRSPKLEVTGVEIADGGTGVIVNQSPRAEVTSNGFYRLYGTAVQVLDPSAGDSKPAGENLIAGNVIGKVSVGVHLCGIQSGGNRVQDNEIQAALHSGILLTDHSGGNVIVGNWMHNAYDTGIRMEASVANTLDRNRVTSARIGLALVARHDGYCHGDPEIDHYTFGHKVYDNRIEYADVAIAIGDHLDLGKVYHTVFAHNRIDISDVGLQFEANSVENTAYGTVFGAVVTPVIDLGYGNTW